MNRDTAACRIAVRGLGKVFQLGEQRVEAVQDVSFRVRQGEFVCSGRLDRAKAPSST
jgi:ABC-type glutathione transport system ATPase component